MNTPEQRAAYINAQVACAMIEAMGMQAQNDYRKHIGEAPEYKLEDFENLLEQYVVNHNSVISYLREV